MLKCYILYNRTCRKSVGQLQLDLQFAITCVGEAQLLQQGLQCMSRSTAMNVTEGWLLNFQVIDSIVIGPACITSLSKRSYYLIPVYGSGEKWLGLRVWMCSAHSLRYNQWRLWCVSFVQGKFMNWAFCPFAVSHSISQPPSIGMHAKHLDSYDLSMQQMICKACWATSGSHVHPFCPPRLILKIQISFVLTCMRCGNS